MKKSTRYKKARVLFLGSHPVSFKCLQYMVSKCGNLVETIGVVPHISPPLADVDQAFRDFCSKQHISIFSFDKVASLSYDLGISVLFDRKLSPEIVAIPPRGFVNIHLGPLPQLRGVCSVLHAIRLYRKENRWNFGVTLHYIDEGIDTGPIIKKLEIPISENDTGESLHSRACEKAYELFVRNIQALLKSKKRLPVKPQKGKSYLFRKDKINHKIDLNWPPDVIYDTVRALTFKGKPKPYIIIGKHRFYLSLREDR